MEFSIIHIVFSVHHSTDRYRLSVHKDFHYYEEKQNHHIDISHFSFATLQYD